jgi:hypothetical protein
MVGLKYKNMKAILEFDLPDDQADFDLANKGGKYYFVLWEMDQWYRSKIKYDGTLSDEQYKMYEDSREHLRGLMYDNGVTFND